MPSPAAPTTERFPADPVAVVAKTLRHELDRGAVTRGRPAAAILRDHLGLERPDCRRPAPRAAE